MRVFGSASVILRRTGSHCRRVDSLVVIAQGEVHTLVEMKRPPSATLQDSVRQLGQCSMVLYIAVLSISTYGDSEML